MSVPKHLQEWSWVPPSHLLKDWLPQLHRFRVPQIIAIPIAPIPIVPIRISPNGSNFDCSELLRIPRIWLPRFWFGLNSNVPTYSDFDFPDFIAPNWRELPWFRLRRFRLLRSLFSLAMRWGGGGWQSRQVKINNFYSTIIRMEILSQTCLLFCLLYMYCFNSFTGEMRAIASWQISNTGLPVLYYCNNLAQT